jgi:hypothetical protein
MIYSSVGITDLGSSMDQEKRWPKVGDKLTHTYRKKVGQAEAEVISVDKKSGAISLRIGKQVYPSLSSAAEAVSGAAANGWVYWGLKKQHSRK